MTVETTLVNKIKKALRIEISDTNFDDELTDMANAAILDLGVAGVEKTSNDAIINRAVITYCKMNFGTCEPAEYDRLKASYDEQKSQLSNCTGYTDWGDSE